ncbi:MAG: hypothetical protein K0U98_01740 [Deltaproteobacteria bacterium]|nr:hypothetical protein [Deltaproteobacteria bacterium]
MERRSEMPDVGNEPEFGQEDLSNRQSPGDGSRRDRLNPEQVLDELAGPRLEWQRMVRKYPLASLVAATMGGLYLGKRYGWQMIDDLSAFAADELVRNVQTALDADPD